MAKEKTKHQLLIEAAEKSIDDLFADTSVSQSKTREALDNLAGKIEILMVGLSEVD